MLPIYQTTHHAIFDSYSTCFQIFHGTGKGFRSKAFLADGAGQGLLSPRNYSMNSQPHCCSALHLAVCLDNREVGGEGLCSGAVLIVGTSRIWKKSQIKILRAERKNMTSNCVWFSIFFLNTLQVSCGRAQCVLPPFAGALLLQRINPYHITSHHRSPSRHHARDWVCPLFCVQHDDF